MTILDKALLFFLEMFGVLMEEKPPMMRQKLAEELGTYWGRDESVTVGCSFCEFD